MQNEQTEEMFLELNKMVGNIVSYTNALAEKTYDLLTWIHKKQEENKNN